MVLINKLDLTISVIEAQTHTISYFLADDEIQMCEKPSAGILQGQGLYMNYIVKTWKK